MKRMSASLYRFAGQAVATLRKEDGQTMTEYGMLLAVIVIVVIAIAIVLGSSISNLFAPVIQDL